VVMVRTHSMNAHASASAQSCLPDHFSPSEKEICAFFWRGKVHV